MKNKNTLKIMSVLHLIIKNYSCDSRRCYFILSACILTLRIIFCYSFFIYHSATIFSNCKVLQCESGKLYERLSGNWCFLLSLSDQKLLIFNNRQFNIMNNPSILRYILKFMKEFIWKLSFLIFCMILEWSLWYVSN